MLQQLRLRLLAILTGHLPPRSCVGLQKAVKIRSQRFVSRGRNPDVSPLMGRIFLLHG